MYRYVTPEELSAPDSYSGSPTRYSGAENTEDEELFGVPRSSLGATRYPASPTPRSYPSHRFRDMSATVSSPALALMPPHIMMMHHAGGVYVSTCPSPAAEYRHGCPSPRRTWWRRNATVQVGVALAPHGLTVPDGAKRGRHCLVWTRLARSSQQRPTNGKVLAYRSAIDDVTPSFDAAADGCEHCTPAAPPRTSLMSSASPLPMPMPAPE
eukprot:scaffold14244_cov129-Isochrysis_galbana.AAC.5